MRISFVLDNRDAALFTLYRNLEHVDVKRKKAVLRWIVALMLLAILPVFQLNSTASVSMLLIICFLWLSLSGPFMNHVLLKQILKEQKAVDYAAIEIESNETGLQIQTAGHEHKYGYDEITHFLYFRKLLLLTLYNGSSILIPRHAFESKQAFKAFYMHILNHCPEG